MNNLRAIAEESEIDPGKAEQLNEQLHAYRNLVQKHKVMNVDELITLRNQLDQELQDMNMSSARADELRVLIEQEKEECRKLSAKISENRYLVLNDISNKWKSDLNQLGMPNGEIRFSLDAHQEFNRYGTDHLEIQFSSNKGGSFEPLHKVASGGEMSRIMLIIKSYLAGISTLPTMILDEIDTGVSGETARQVAEMMESLSKKHQLITITHLPQIAAKGQKHFYVYKEDSENITRSYVKELTEDERVDEIAKMLSGENPTESARKNALELISS